MQSLSRLATALALGVVLIVVANVISVARQAAKSPRAYVLVQVDVTNAAQYAEYAKLTPDIIAKYRRRRAAWRSSSFRVSRRLSSSIRPPSTPRPAKCAKGRPLPNSFWSRDCRCPRD